MKGRRVSEGHRKNIQHQKCATRKGGNIVNAVKQTNLDQK